MTWRGLTVARFNEQAFFILFNLSANVNFYLIELNVLYSLKRLHALSFNRQFSLKRGRTTVDHQAECSSRKKRIYIHEKENPRECQSADAPR